MRKRQLHLFTDGSDKSPQIFLGSKNLPKLFMNSASMSDLQNVTRCEKSHLLPCQNSDSRQREREGEGESEREREREREQGRERKRESRERETNGHTFLTFWKYSSGKQCSQYAIWNNRKLYIKITSMHH